ncbi:GntR family transcriptional regulator [Lachnospiraceae bacterium 54-53]
MILLDYKDRRPIYEQVVEKLKDLMICGVLDQDMQLPSVRALATDLSINPNTIQRAYAELERRGFIYSVKGRGSFVADTSSVRALKNSELKKDLRRWVEEAKRGGLTEDKAHTWIAEEWTKQQYLAEEDREYDKSRESDKKV